MTTINHQFDAFGACRNLRGQHAGFLLDRFRVAPGHVHNELVKNWTGTSDERLFAPIVVQGAWPYVPGSSIDNLDERILHPHTKSLLRLSSIGKYPLYQHQVEAIQAGSEGKSFGLAAGTGSGKTESFLLPILDRLYRDAALGLDDLSEPGVRAIIVYPLNALVNNQIQRIAEILDQQPSGLPQIRFAYYTSRLREAPLSAKSGVRDQEQLVEAQITNREDLRATPPHILVTNFSMLEYMLIRPHDQGIFADEKLFYTVNHPKKPIHKIPRCKMIVLDEAHIYMGAQATEIHLLLRRAADRFGTKLADMQGFATSATLGDGSSQTLSRFVADIFAQDPANCAAILGQNDLPKLPPSSPPSISETPSQIPPLSAQISAQISARDIVEHVHIPESLHTLDVDAKGSPCGLYANLDMCISLGEALQKANLLKEIPVEEYPAKLLWEMCIQQPKLVELRRWLFEQEQQKQWKTVDEIAAYLFSSLCMNEQEQQEQQKSRGQEEQIQQEARAATEILLQLASLARPTHTAHPFIPVRMHTVMRAPAGAWVDTRAVSAPADTSTDAPSQDGWRWGAVTSKIPADGVEDQYKLEMRLCSSCGRGYLRALARLDDTRKIYDDARSVVRYFEKHEIEYIGQDNIREIAIAIDEIDQEALAAFRAIVPETFDDWMPTIQGGHPIAWMPIRRGKTQDDDAQADAANMTATGTSKNNTKSTKGSKTTTTTKANTKTKTNTKKATTEGAESETGETALFDQEDEEETYNIGLSANDYIHVDACLYCHTPKAKLLPLRRRAAAVIGSALGSVYPSLSVHPASVTNSPSVFRPGQGRRALLFSDSRQGAAGLAAVVEYTHGLKINRQLLLSSLWHAFKETDYCDPVSSFEDVDSILSNSPRVYEHPDSPIKNEIFSKYSLYLEFARLSAQGNTLETLGLVEVLYPKLDKLPVPENLQNVFSVDEWQDFLRNILDMLRRRGAVKNNLESAFDIIDKNEHNTRLLAYRNKMVQRYFDVKRYIDKKVCLHIDKIPAEDRKNYIALLSKTKRPSMFQEYANRIIETIKQGNDKAAKYLQKSSEINGDLLLLNAFSALVMLGKSAKESMRGALRTIYLQQDTTDGDYALEIDLKKVEFRLSPLVIAAKKPDQSITPIWIDPKTRRLAFRSVRGVPVDQRGGGTLILMNNDEIQHWRQRDSIKSAIDPTILGMYTIEHTAQIDVNTLEANENKFKDGQKNILSSSTTMEMGIDLGGLTFVMMTNVPPGPANYWQRSGRAGRRADGSSLVLTVAKAQPHDQRVFSSLRDFWRRPIVPPLVRTDADDLVKRHVNAWLLTQFYREWSANDAIKAWIYSLLGASNKNPMQVFGKVRLLVHKYSEQHGERYFHDAFATWCRRSFPVLSASTAQNTTQNTEQYSELHHHVARLFEKDPTIIRAYIDDGVALLSRIAQETILAYDVIQHQKTEIQVKLNSAKNEHKTQLQRADKLLGRQLSNLEGEEMISHLARHGFLPIFGFPIDVIRLRTDYYTDDHESSKKTRHTTEQNSTEQNSREQNSHAENALLRLERDLKLALSEYAPGSEVIADKKRHIVRGVVKNWLNEDVSAIVQRYCLHCSACGGLTVAPSSAALVVCSICQKNATDAEKRTLFRPTGFTVSPWEEAKVVADRLERKQIPTAKLLLGAMPVQNNKNLRIEETKSSFALGFAHSQAIVQQDGNGHGYAICQYCGYVIPEIGTDEPPSAIVGHYHLTRGGTCEFVDKIWRNQSFGMDVKYDTLRLQINPQYGFSKVNLNVNASANNAVNNTVNNNKNTNKPAKRADVEKSLYYTLALLMRQAASEVLQVDARSLDFVVSTSPSAFVAVQRSLFGPDELTYTLESALIDPSNTGLLRYLVEDPSLYARFVQTLLRMIDDEDEGKLILFETQHDQNRIRPTTLRLWRRESGAF